MGLPGSVLFQDVEFVGFYLPPLLLWAGCAVIPFLIIRRLMERIGIYRFVWHRPLFNLALYVLLVGVPVLLGNLI
jgi:hypothetical protein